MADAVDISEAETHLSELLDRVIMGEEIVLAQAGRPVAKLVRMVPEVAKRAPGSAERGVSISPSFDAPLSNEMFDGFD